MIYTQSGVIKWQMTKRAIHILIAVQQRCEEMYLNASEPEIVLFPKKEGGNDIPSSSCGPA